MAWSGWRLGTREAHWLALAAGYGLMLYWNLPGHLTVDSVLALREGRLQVRETWNPALFGWLLGVFDRLVRGTALYVAVSGLLLAGSWAALGLLRPRVSWLAPALAAGVVLLPQVLIYQGIVWKDVLFANTAVAAFVALALAARAWPRRRTWGWLAGAAVLLAAAGLLRQNGLILVAPAAAAVAWAVREAGWRRSLGMAAGWTVAVMLLTLTLASVAQPQGVGKPDSAGGRGLRILQHYDLAGATVRDPDYPLPHIDRQDPEADDYLRARAPSLYSPERVDTFKRDERMGFLLWRLPDEAVRAEWLDLVTRRPATYLQTRFDAFRWVFATPVIDRCLPLSVGVQGPEPALRDLAMEPRQDRRDMRLYYYATWFFDTPAMSHLAYAALAGVVGVFLLARRDPADIAMLAMIAGALLFTASFFVISIACDYRYLYFLDLAALTGLLYVAIDPRLRRAP